MEHYAGIDVSLESASVCVVDATGRIVREAKVASEPEVLIGWFRGLGLAVTRIGLEAGPLSQWLYAGMRDAGLAVELLETRHVRNAFKAMPVKKCHPARKVELTPPFGGGHDQRHSQRLGEDEQHPELTRMLPHPSL
jgi:hypothetical protein